MRTTARRAFVCGAFMVSCLLAGQAQAIPVVVDFNAASLVNFATTPYAEDGVNMTVVTGHYDIFAGTTRYANIDSVSFGNSLLTFDMDGAPFTLVSIDFPITGEVGTLTPFGGAAIPIVATGGTMLFNLANITSFTLAHGSTFLAFDNITIETVPEPVSMLLLAAGFAGVAVRARRHR